MYKINNFYNSDIIAVLGRGKSVRYISHKTEFVDCFLVGQFSVGMNDLEDSLMSKNIVQVVNKVSIKTDKNMFSKFGIKDIQCNIAPDMNGNLSKAKTKVYKRVVSSNKHATVHLGPKGIKERRVREVKTWVTTGLYAIDLAAFFQPKEIWIFGVDFYDSGYFAKEKINVSIKSNRKRKKDMLKNLHGIVKRDRKIEFKIFTTSHSIKSGDNLYVYNV